MFDFVRNHSRLVLGIMVLLIFPSFVFFGIQGYSRFTDPGNDTVAKVDGHGITRTEWELAHQRQVEQMRRQMPNVDSRLLETPEMKRETLDQIVRDRVLMAAANQQHLYPDMERLDRLFKTDPQYAQLRNPDGSVNKDLLASQGMSSEMFAAQMRQTYGVQQVLAGPAQSAFAPPSAAAPSLDAMLQRREVQVQRFETAAYKAKVNPTDADLEAFYKKHEADFRAPEQAAIEFVTLTLDSLMKGISVPEDELRKYYEENASRYAVAEERRASHILLKVDPDAKAADREAAKQKAEELVAQLRKNPGQFAELAKKNSQDPGSAAKGGDLDFFGRGMMVKPFEDAVFAMKPGEISNPVLSDFGYHIITLTAVRGGDRKPFESVRAEIEAEVKRSLAQKKYAEAAEQFTNTVYEQSDSLQPVIDKLKLEKMTATVTRSPAPGAQGALGSVKFLEALFGNDAVKNKRNTDAVEVGPNQLASGRIVKYEPARTRPLAEVKDGVRERVVAEMAAEQARKEGMQRLAELQKTPTETLPTTLTVSRLQPQGLPREALEAVLRADAGKLPAVLGQDIGGAGYLVLRVTQVLARETPPGGDAPLLQQYSQAWAAAESQAYLASLKKRYKAEVKTSALVAAAASAAAP